MAHIATALFAIAAVLGSALSVTQASLTSATDASAAWQQMVEDSGDRRRTNLTLIQADIGGSGSDVRISFRNSGQTSLAKFPQWDLVLQYYSSVNNQDLKIAWLPHTTSTPPDSGEWRVEGIYQDATGLVPEVYEPNILNPGEEMIVQIRIVPDIPANTDNRATIGVANGITLAAPFSR